MMVLTQPLQLAPNMFSCIATSAFANVHVNRYTFKLALCGPAKVTTHHTDTLHGILQVQCMYVLVYYVALYCLHSNRCHIK